MEQTKGGKAIETSLDEMWTDVGCRRGRMRRSVWIWTAEVDGRFRFVVGERDEPTFGRLAEDLPWSQRYATDGRAAYATMLLVGWHVVGEAAEGRVNRNERYPDVGGVGRVSVADGEVVIISSFAKSTFCLT